MGYLTLNEAPDNANCLALYVPNSIECLAIVRGALLNLLEPANWQRYGALTQQESASVFFEMVDGFCSEQKPGCRVIGELIPFAGANSPNPNWLQCNGAMVAIADYPDLYAVIGLTYGPASDEYFLLPDLTGRSAIGYGSHYGARATTLGQKYGAYTHVITIDEMPAHTHSTGNSLTGAAVMPGEGPVLIPNPIPAQTGSAGSGSAIPTESPSSAINWLIVAKNG